MCGWFCNLLPWQVQATTVMSCKVVCEQMRVHITTCRKTTHYCSFRVRARWNTTNIYIYIYVYTHTYKGPPGVLRQDGLGQLRHDHPAGNSLSLSLSLSFSLSHEHRWLSGRSRSCLRMDLGSIPTSANHWVGYESALSSKSAGESQTWNPTGHPDLRSPCRGIIRLAGRTAGKNPSSQSEAARCTPGALTGWSPAARKQKGC